MDTHVVPCPGGAQFYEGGSRIRGVKRQKEHEASVRRFNTRTTTGQHMRRAHSELEPENICYKLSFAEFVKHFKPELIDRGIDTLDTFVREGILDYLQLSEILILLSWLVAGCVNLTVFYQGCHFHPSVHQVGTYI